MRARGFGGAGLAGLVAVGALFVGAGCELLSPTFPGEEFLDPKPIATYTTGNATITLGDGTKIELDRLHGKSELYESFGSSVTWTNGEGWYLQVSAYETFGSRDGYLTISRIEGPSHWSTSDSSRCIVDIDKTDETGVKGTATCKGLEWFDALGGGMSMGGSAIEGEKKFDAEITFEAAPKGQVG